MFVSVCMYVCMYVYVCMHVYIHACMCGCTFVFELDGRKEKTLLDKLHKKLTSQLKIMDVDLDDTKERYKYLSAAPVLANMYLLIKLHNL